MNPIAALAYLLALATGKNPDASDAWDEEEGEDERADVDELQAAVERTTTNVVEIDATAAAATSKYRGGSYKGKIKRTLFRRIPHTKLAGRRVILMVHQTGFEASSRASVWPKITAHDVVRPDAALLHLHPYDVRLVAGNRVDRAPWHGVHLEVGGNFERTDGEGDWWSPETQGRGRASEGQINAARYWIERTRRELAHMGVLVAGVAPHRIAGRDSKGRPNRHACPGSRLHAEVVEWAGAELGLAVPGPGFALGGATIPDDWHGEYWSRCRKYIAA